MAKHGYASGRLNLPFVGHCTFAKAPIGPNLADFEADFAELGVPNDMGTQYRPGARFGPRGIREASTLFSFGHSGAHDFEDDINYLPSSEVTIVDIGDVDIVHTDMEQAVRQILATGATPITLGGDHSIHDPSMAAYSEQEPLHLVHFDAHLDFVDQRHGVSRGHGNPLRRSSEKPWVTGMTQMGIRNVSSSNREDYEAARAAGSKIFSVRDKRRIGTQDIVDEIPEIHRYYVTIDIDGFDPSIVPSTGTPSHGGFCITKFSKSCNSSSKRARLSALIWSR